MTENEEKSFSSWIRMLKGTILQNVAPENYEKFILWCNKLAIDTKKIKKKKSCLEK